MTAESMSDWTDGSHMQTVDSAVNRLPSPLVELTHELSLHSNMAAECHTDFDKSLKSDHINSLK